MTQPVNLARSTIGSDCVECYHHRLSPFSHSPPRAGEAAQTERIGAEPTLGNMESLSTFWSGNRAQAKLHVHNFKMEWMWQEEQYPRPVGQPGSCHALQDYQMQLMLLEQQNKKRLMIARMNLAGASPPVLVLTQQSIQNNGSSSSARETPHRAAIDEKTNEGHRNLDLHAQPPLFPRAMRCPDLHGSQKKAPQLKKGHHEKTSESFPQFSKLSAELRVKIWTYASLVPRIVELYIYFPHRDTIISPAKPPAVLHVCRESRYEALKYYKPSFNIQPTNKLPTNQSCTAGSTPNKKSPEFKRRPQMIYFNPSLDTIYVGEATWKCDLITFLTCLPPSEASKIEALAIPLRLAEGSKLSCIDDLPALRELIYVTPVPHQFCILLRYRDLWFEDTQPNPFPSTTLPSSEFYVKHACIKRHDGKSVYERRMKGGVADRARRKEAWLLRREERRTVNGGEGGKKVEDRGNFAETFWMRVVGGRESWRGAEGEEEAWMPPGSCEYCKAHREGRARALREAGS